MPKGDRAKLKADPLDGTTPISHLLLEALAMAKLSGREKGAMLILWRNTYGWFKGGVRLKEEHITLNKWAEGLNTNQSHASETITQLVKHNIIKQISLGQGKGYIYTTNTNIAEWNGNCINKEALLKIVTLPENGNPSRKWEGTLPENGNGTLPENGNGTLPENGNPIMPTKAILNKDIKETPLKKGGTAEMLKGTFEDIFNEIRKLPQWSAQESDSEWVGEILQEYPFISVSLIRNCRDWHMAKHPKGKHIWKSALRNWLKGEESNGSRTAIQQPSERKQITGNESRGGIAALVALSEDCNRADN